MMDSTDQPSDENCHHLHDEDAPQVESVRDDRSSMMMNVITTPESTTAATVPISAFAVRWATTLTVDDQP